jgi:segregation and condensation protein A
LIEYQRYKEAANNLNQRPQLYRDFYSAAIPEEEAKEAEESVVLEGNAFLLLEAFNQMLAKLPKEMARKAPTLDRISVNERILQIIERLRCGKTLPLSELMPEMLTKHIIVVSFLALLEMAALRMIKVYQTGRYEPIYVTSIIQDASLEETKSRIQKRELKTMEGSDGTEPTEVNN